MDENKNPDLTNNEENPSNESEKSEFESFMDNQNDSEEAASEMSEQVTKLVLTDEVPENAEPPKKKNSKGKTAALIIILVLLVAATAGLVFFAFNSNSSKLDLDKTVMKVGDIENTAAEYYQIYSYYSAYAYYYQYTEEQIREMTKQQIVLIDTLYSEAVKAGYTLTEEDNAAIDEQMKSITTEAEAASMTEEEFLDANVCKGYTMEMLRGYIEKQHLANKYYEDHTAEIQKKYEGSDALKLVEDEYKANSKKYDMPNISYGYFDATEKDADSKADALIAEVKAGKTFNEAMKNATGKNPNTIVGYGYDQIASSFAQEAADWIYKTKEDGSYENGKGAITKLDVNGVIYVLYADNAPARDDSLPVNINYIKVDVSKDTSVKSADELKVTAKATANKILKEYTDGEKTAASFETLASKYDNGDDELISGDVFEDLTKTSAQDKAVVNWAFAEGRKAGDCELVEAEDCYYILYAASIAKEPLWQTTVRNSLISADIDEWTENTEAIHKDDTVEYTEEIEKVIAYIKEQAQKQNSAQ